MFYPHICTKPHKKGRFNFDLQDTLNALLKKFLGFTLDMDAVFSLPGQTELEKFINDNFIDYIKYPEKYQRYRECGHADYRRNITCCLSGCRIY